MKKEEKKGWYVARDGAVVNSRNGYALAKDRLAEDDWLLHLLEKGEEDWNSFIPAYFEALKRARVKEVQILSYYQ